MLIIPCPKCSKPLKAPQEAMGKPVKCVCGHRFILKTPSVPSPTLDVRSLEGGTDSISLLRKRRRKPLASPGVVVASVVGVAILAVGVWFAVPVVGAKPVSAEAPPEKPAAGAAADATVGADIAERLQEAEDKLATLTETYTRERERLVMLALEKRSPPELHPSLRDTLRGKPDDVVIENEQRRYDLEDRGLSLEARLEKSKARTAKTEHNLEVMHEFDRQRNDPQSEVSREINSVLESLESTKELGKQRELVARLRREAEENQPPPEKAASIPETGADLARRLKVEEQKFAALSAIYAKERRRLIIAETIKRTPDEYLDSVMDIVNGTSREVSMENHRKSVEEEDRGLSLEEQLARSNARGERTKREKRRSEEFNRQLDDPQSAVSRKLDRDLESLDSTKRLWKQYRLLERLRRAAGAAPAPVK
jgi:hypothetical protein